jgi:PST family polysaccharide transporter
MSLVKVAKNFISIFFLQAINYLLPIVILPYLIKVVGMAKFVLSNYVLTLFITLKILIDFGYNISGVKSIAENKANTQQLSIIFSRIFFSKLFLLLLAIIIICISVAFIPIFHQNIGLIFFSGSNRSIFNANLVLSSFRKN